MKYAPCAPASSTISSSSLMAYEANFILMKPILAKKLKNVWQHVYRHQIKASQKLEYKANNPVE
ncbi:hypothetical protein HAX54_003633, partial [Datura stramonium]|nr:hypothetical protein [Datura stramonium]